MLWLVKIKRSFPVSVKKNGKCLIWDFTCEDTLCKTYVKKASTEVGSAAAGREDKKVEKYSNLSDNYHFVPVGVETYWHLWSSRHQQIGKKNQEATSEKLSTFFSISKYINGNTTRQCSLWIWVAPQKKIFRLRGPI